MSLLLANKYLPTDYNISLKFSKGKPNFEGELRFSLAASPWYQGTNGDTESFKLILNAHKLVILDARLDNKVLSVITDKPRQTIELVGKEDSPIRACLDITPESTVNIKFLGVVNNVRTATADQVGGAFIVNGNYDLITTQTQPVFARQIYPVIDDLNFKVPVQLTVKADPNVTVVSNTQLVSEDHENGVFQFEKTPPMLASNFAFTIGDLKYVETEVEGTSVRVYCQPQNVDNPKTLQMLEILKTLLPILAAHLGPYPLDKLDLVAIPYLFEGAMENWGAITVMSDYLYKSNQLDLYKLISHELVHQWIGNLISFSSWKHLWLNEALATFLGNYFVSLVDEKYNMMEELMTINSKLLTIKELNIQKFMNKLVIDDSVTINYLFNHLVYEKGIMILRMIVNLIGEGIDNYDPFLQGFKLLIQEKKFTTINSNEIWQHFAKLYHVDLLSFINIWYRYDKYPIIQVNYDPEHEQLIINQNQSQIYMLPLVIKTETDDIKVIITEKMTTIAYPKQLLIFNKNKISLARLEISKKVINKVDISKLNKQDCQSYLIDFPTGGFNKKIHARLQSLK